MANGTSSPPIALDYAARPERARLGVTERNFLRAGLYTAAIVFIFWCGYYFERSILHRHPADIRFIREASEAAMRYITIPHIVIGFLFMISSPKNQNLRQRLWAAGLLIAGAALCTLYWKGGGKANLLLYSGVYLYFLVHELRDEAMFYTVLGEAAPIADKTAFKGLVRWMTGLIVFTMGAFVWAPIPFGLYYKKLTEPTSALANWATLNASWLDGSMSLPLRIALSVTPFVLSAVGFAIVLRHFAARLKYPDVQTLFRNHAVLFKVMFGVAAVLGLSLILTARAYSLILFHVVAWYIFAAYQFAKHPPKAPSQGWWTWMRTSVRGFKTLHIGMVVVLMAIGLVWTIGLDRTSSLAWLLAPESFLYWTILHITVSFVPR
ncbi:MAG TPA: hypothetical protein VJZ71_00975 [Phycisphaerae bacterium]|nr:hypothetical protein [Phycisphaerae bacterium]